MTKNDIISLINIKDYNNILETILEAKGFSKEVRNLLLSMLYKVENSYKDYEKVKKDSLKKKTYIKNLLNIINDCEDIILAKANSDELKDIKKLYKTEENKIIVYQNELAVLKALFEMKEKQIAIKDKYNFYEKALRKMLEVGFVSDNVEVIRDFNGWSWDINTRELEDINYNLIYQNMLMLFGCDFVNAMLNNDIVEEDEIPNNEILRSKYSQIASFEEDTQRDYLEEMQERVREQYGDELLEKIKNDFLKVILIKISNIDEEERKKILEEKNRVTQLLEKMLNKEEYLEEITNKKKKLIQEIKKIDNVVNNTEILKNEYKKVNEKLPNKEKIFSPSQYANILILKRKSYMNEINKINKIMDPMEFVKIKEETKKKNEFLDIWEENKKIIDEQKYIEELQKDFLDCLFIQMQKSANRKDILDLIYKLRYYKCMSCGDKKIFEIESLKEKIEEVQKSFIKKACEKKIITKFSEDEELNYKILKDIFVSKIVDLESIIYILKYNKDTLEVEIYDGEIIEERKEIKIRKKTELSVKLKKKIKLICKV